MLRAEVWLATTLISIGVIGGLLYNWPTAQTPQQRDNPTADSTTADDLFDENDSMSIEIEDASPTVFRSGDDIAEGDNLLIGGNYDGAYRLYVREANRNQGVASSTLLLRMAIANEGKGDAKQAALLYQNAIKHSGGQLYLRLMGLSGLSRVWMAQSNYEQALELLSELVLQYGTLDQTPEEIRYQIHYQLSEAAQRVYLDKALPAGSEPKVEFHWCEPIHESMLDLMPANPTAANRPETATSLSIEVLQRPADDAGLITINIKGPAMSVRELFQEISDKTELSFDFSFAAQASAVSRVAKLNLQELPLSVVLDTITSPLGLIWTQDGTKIRLQHNSESEKASEQFFLERAQRSLRRIRVELPDSLRRVTSLLHEGNLALISGDASTGITRYEELNAAGVNGELAAKLNYNMATVDTLNGRTESAISRLYLSVDQSLDHAVQAKSYAQIARMHLENGDTEGAIYAASRGLTLSTTDLMREKTAMTMATAYLLRNESLASNRILFDNEAYIQSPTAQHLASVYGAYARLLGRPEKNGMRTERMQLIVALSSIEPKDVDNFIDALLVARAFFAVGFTSKAMDLANYAMTNAVHPYWKRQAAYDLATLRYGAGELEEALDAFAVIFRENSTAFGDEIDRLGIKAQLKCAIISMQLGDTPESKEKWAKNCLSHCQELWKLQLNEDQKSQTLSLMGQAYRQLGRHRTAAVCFSGMIPKDDGTFGKAETQ